MPATKQLHINPALHDRMKKRAKKDKVTLGVLTESFIKAGLKPVKKEVAP